MKNGKHLMKYDQQEIMDVVMPTKKWNDWICTFLPIENFAYIKMNDIDRGYII